MHYELGHEDSQVVQVVQVVPGKLAREDSRAVQAVQAVQVVPGDEGEELSCVHESQVLEGIPDPDQDLVPYPNYVLLEQETCV